MKKKPLLLRLLPWALLAALLSGMIYIGYLLWGQPEQDPLYTAEIIRFEGESTDPVVLDNGQLRFEMDPLTTQFVLTDAYGHEWKSNPFSDPAASGETIASDENRKALASTLNVYFRLPRKGVDDMYDNYSYSVTRSAYRIRKTDDNTVEVTYSLGDIAREFVLPESLTRERYDELSALVKASGTPKKQFTGKYGARKSAAVMKQLAGSDAKEREEAAGLLASYPQIASQDVFVVTADDNKNLGALETLLAKIGYSEEDRHLDLILSRSSYYYTYHRYTPEEITALRGGGEEEKALAERLLAKDPGLADRPGYILQRTEQVITPAAMEKLQAGNEAQAEYAGRLAAAFPGITEDPVTVVKLEGEEAAALYTVDELMDERNYSEPDRLTEGGIFEMAEKPVDVLFDVTVRYRLDGKDFIAEVPYGDIRFNSASATLTYVSVLPMFGTAGAGEDGSYEDGYLLVPEGGGALIGFNNRKINYPAYYADVYGYDYGIKRSEFVSEPKAQFPVFGILRKEQSFLCVVEGGSAFVSIRGDINGLAPGTDRSSYNYVNAKAQVLHLDEYNVSAKTSEIQLMAEKKIPETTLVQRYRFTDSGDYTRLAEAYGDYLRETYPELRERQVSRDTPVSVELIGAIDKRVVTLGMPVRKVVPTTTFAQAEKIITSLCDSGTRNLHVRFSGWLRGGVKQKALTGVRVLGELGGEKGARDLIRSAENAGAALYFDGITAFVYDSGLGDGFLVFRDAARHLTRETAVLARFSPIYYKEDEELDAYTLAKPAYAKENADRLIAWLKENGAGGAAFRDIGCLLSADYDPNRTTDREQVKALNIRTLEAAREAGERVMVKEGFDFTLPLADIVTDMPLSGNRYMILDRHIPFFQIALHGMIDYTGQPLNLAGDSRTELLRCAEYGAGLNYTFMAEDASVTQETEYTGLFGTTYASWQEEAKETILRYQRETEGLNRLRITGHEEMTEHVRVTRYEDGTAVYVNYGSEDYAGTVRIPARDYLVVRKEGR